MANELTYQSEFTGQQMDAKFTAVAELQTAITELQAAVNAKYSKPSAGIPSTDLDADVNAALAKANSAIQSLADYYTKAEVDALIATINGQEYVDVSSLPTASASTMGKIYLVGPDGSGYYSYYYTSYDGSAYSWVGPLGTTQISLANYATKAELNQLDQKVGEEETASPTIEQGGIGSANGQDSASTKRLRTNGYITAERLYVNPGTGKAYAFGYNASGTFVGKSDDWFEIPTNVEISGAVKYRLCFSYVNDATITPSNYASLGVEIVGIYGETVRIERQHLSDNEKQIARENIGAAPGPLLDEVFGKTTQLYPSVQVTGTYIKDDGTTASATNYVISSPIAIKRGQKVTIHSYIPKNAAGLALTNSSGSAYTPVIVNDSTGAVMTKDYIAPADCYVAWCYITSQTHEIFVSAAIDIYAIYEEVGEKTGILDFNPDVEFVPKFIAAKKQTNGVSPLVLQVFSDIHGKALDNLPRILQFHSAHATRIDEILNLGDMVSDQYSNTFVFGQIDGAENVLSIIGNHDTATKDGSVYDWTAHAGLDAYNKYIAPFVSNWGVTQPENAAANGYCYYYKDYETQDIRIVFLDVMGYDATQEAWLTDVLADAKTSGLSVLIAAHYPSAAATGFEGKYSLLVDNVFNRPAYNPSFYGAVNVVESFISGGGEFISWLTGHRHDDFLGKLNNTNQVCLTVDTSQFGSNSASNEYDKVEGTPTQDAFSIICIDTQAKTLSTFKVGCRRDKWQRTRDSVCVNYETATVLCEN